MKWPFLLVWQVSHRASGQPKSLDSVLTSSGSDVKTKMLKYHIVSFMILPGQLLSLRFWNFVQVGEVLDHQLQP